MEEVPEILAGRWRLVRRIGRGGMGVVFQVVDDRTKRRCAMKVMGRGDGALAERFRREASALVRIRSEHVVRVLEADVLPELDGRPYMVMEHLRGRDVLQWLIERGRFTPRETLTLLTQAARGVARAHALGIVHRDLKPENLFLHEEVDGRRVLKVVDFGLASDKGLSRITLTGEALGTPLYMSPEQVRGTAVDARTDVWAFGVMACEMLTGKPYFDLKSVPAILSAIVRGPVVMPSRRWMHLPRAFDAWFFKSCAVDPAQRFANVTEQMDALAEALGLRVVAVPVTQPTPPRWAGIASLAAGATLALVGLVVCAEPQAPAASVASITIAPQPSGSATPPEDPAPRPPVTVVASSLSPRASVSPSSLSLVCSPSCDVVLDGAAIGAAPIGGQSVTAGAHTVVLTSNATKKTVSFVAKPGETTALRIDMR